MASFEERIENNINSGIARTIWENETKTHKKITRDLMEHGGHDGVNIYYLTRKVKCGMATIDMVDDEIIYAITADEVGDVILARVKPDKVEFPQYGTQKRMGLDKDGKKKIEGFEKSGKLALSEVKDTVIETIEKSLREHPVMGKYADIILGDFKKILSLDPKREIQPISEEAMINAALLEDNAKKEAQIGRLQAMLNKTLEFAKNVRDSVVGKIFFRNEIAQLDLPEGELTEGDKVER